MSLFNWDDINDAFEKIWDRISHFIHDDFRPAVEKFFKQFATHEGELILATAAKFAPQLISGKFGDVSAAIIKELVAGSAVIAAQDLAVTLQQVQSALQVAKIEQNIQTPSDQTIVANVAATEKVLPA